MEGAIVTTVMVSIGLLTTGVTIFIAWRALRTAGGMLRGLAGDQPEVQRLQQSGQPANGRVLGLQPGSRTVTLGVQRSIELFVDLEVWIAGRAPYRAQVRQKVSELRIASLQPGAQVALRVDPYNSSRVIIADTSAGSVAALPGLGVFG